MAVTMAVLIPTLETGLPDTEGSDIRRLRPMGEPVQSHPVQSRVGYSDFGLRAAGMLRYCCQRSHSGLMALHNRVIPSGDSDIPHQQLTVNRQPSTVNRPPSAVRQHHPTPG
ncbi:hypothetical protein B7494_g8472 [Chlorociboria aeruginascens]|nr:hypothetical protein B7494_g8472 [Chlorociboria aeruginascens]